MKSASHWPKVVLRAIQNRSYQVVWYKVNTLRLSTTEEIAVFKRSITGAVMRTALPFASFATDKMAHFGAKGFRAVANQLESKAEDVSNLENTLHNFDFDQLIDKVRGIDPLSEVRNLTANNKALEAEVNQLRTQLADAIAPKKKGLSGWWWLVVILTCGLGLFIAAAWWLYGSDDDDLFDEFDDFTLLDTDSDIPQARAASEEAKANAERLVSDMNDDTTDLS